MRGPKEKKERSLGERLHLKAHRCDTPKCAVVRRPYKPGAHGASGGRGRMPSDFSRQLNEKQKFKVTYGLDERNLRRLFEIAKESRGGTSMKLLELLERRLDNAVFRLGIAFSRAEARGFIIHGHINVNGKRVRSPGFQVSNNDMIAVRDVAANATLKELPAKLEQYEPPSWLSLDKIKLEGKVVRLPENEEPPFEINLLVESFSK